jgi:hypothetical protein
MFNKGLLLKVIFGSLAGLVAATGVIYMLSVNAPTNLVVTLPASSCTTVITFRDNSQNEDEFRVYRYDPDHGSKLIRILPASPGIGKQISFTDGPITLGTHMYRVTAYNKFGESDFDQTSVAVTDELECGLVSYIDPSTLPMNPIIVSLSIINDCSVRIAYRDNSTNEQGLKILRDEPYSAPAFILIKTLGPHAGIPGTYDDNTKLPASTYGYRIVAYNQYGESTSNYVTINVDSVCNPAMKFAPTVDVLVVPTAQKLSAETCNWTAAENVFLRKGPDVAVYDRLVDVAAGQGFPIVGQSEDGQFWGVEVEPGVIGYISKSEKFSRILGDCSNVPSLKDPVPPVIEAAPTKKHDGNNNGEPATHCPVGFVCP